MQGQWRIKESVVPTELMSPNDFCLKFGMPMQRPSASYLFDEIVECLPQIQRVYVTYTDPVFIAITFKDRGRTIEDVYKIGLGSFYKFVEMITPEEKISWAEAGF